MVPTHPHLSTKGCVGHVHSVVNSFPIAGSSGVVLAGRRVTALGRIRHTSSRMVDPLRSLRSGLRNTMGFIVLPLFTFTGTNIIFDKNNNIIKTIDVTITTKLLLNGFVNVFLFA